MPELHRRQAVVVFLTPIHFYPANANLQVSRMLNENGRPSNKYLGARFYKCDLQMQTPFDTAHWVGDTFATEEAAAEAFVRHCYQANLEVVALTEHNFISKAQIPLIQMKAEELSKEYG